MGFSSQNGFCKIAHVTQSFHNLTITVNGAKVRKATLNGREYFVAPMTLIVPGVLNGSKGALYYPQEEVERNASAWDWVPIVDGHPYVDGQHQWASYPKLNFDIIQQFGMGFCLNSVAKGKLRSEGWFDIEHTKRINPTVYNRLSKGQPIELSTGLSTDDEPAKNGSKCPSTGRPYQYIARNYRPDHLAVLTGQIGACSLLDGCGVVVNSKDSPMDKQQIWIKLGEALGITVNTPDRHPQTGQFVSQTHGAAIAGSNPNDFEDGGEGTANPDEDYSSKGKDKKDKNEPPEGSLASVILQGKAGKLSANSKIQELAMVLNAEEKFSGPPTQGGTDTLKVKKTAPIDMDGDNDQGNDEDDEDDHQEPSQKKWAEQTSDKGATTNMPFPPSPAPAAPQAPAAIPPSTIHAASKDASMASVGTAHEPVAQHAISAIQASKGGDSSTAADSHMKAAGMHDTAAKGAMKKGDMEGADQHGNAAMLHRKAASMHTACPMPPTGNKSSVSKPNGGSQVAFNKAAAIVKLTANCTCSNDRAAINKMSESTLKMLVGNDGGPASADAGKGGTIQAGGEEESYSEVDPDVDPDKPEKAAKSKMGPEGGTTTQNEAQKYANELYTQARNNVMRVLTANIKDDKAKATVLKLYGKMSLNDLRALAKAQPPIPIESRRQQQREEPSYNYLGAAGGFGEMTENADDGFDKNAILPLPTMNEMWAEDKEMAEAN